MSEDLLRQISIDVQSILSQMNIITDLIENYFLPFLGILIFVVFVCTCIKSL